MVNGTSVLLYFIYFVLGCTQQTYFKVGRFEIPFTLMTQK